MPLTFGPAIGQARQEQAVWEPDDLEVGSMRKSALRTVSVAVLVTGLAVVGSGTASAAGTGRDFGQHVRTCPQTKGFDGEHNPGMHHGFSGWDPSHTC